MQKRENDGAGDSRPVLEGDEMTRHMTRHIYLIGFMGTGKSTIAQRLKTILRAGEIDMDAAIVKEAGMSIRRIFEKYGEDYFRDLETKMLKTISGYRPSVISCGGGTVMRPQNVELMKKSGIIVLLTAEPETVYERVKNSKNRPILNGHMQVDYIAQLMEKRRSAYEAACDVRIPTDNRTPDEIAQEVMTAALPF